MKNVLSLMLMAAGLSFATIAADARPSGRVVIGGDGVSVGIEFGRGGRHHGPGYGRGPGWGGPGYGHGAQFVCQAQNLRGRSFRGRGWSRRQAYHNALDKCYSVSRKCHINSCWVR